MFPREMLIKTSQQLSLIKLFHDIQHLQQKLDTSVKKISSQEQVKVVVEKIPYIIKSSKFLFIY